MNFSPNMRERFKAFIDDLQNQICEALETADGSGKFVEDLWQRDGGGGGRTRVMDEGAVIEKGGVNVSAVFGELPDVLKKQLGVSDGKFYACGLSLVIHPKNPMVPTCHANWRFFEMTDEDGNITDQWFGGGLDLTPYYVFDEDCSHFHGVCKAACDEHGAELYPKYKARCDEYFYNAHRNEGRGIGGLFFDYLKGGDERSLEQWHDFVTGVANQFCKAYVPIINARKNLPYTDAQKTWQEIRRGRYVEFNLIHDKGTIFGLKSNGRIESILMSLPKHVQWHYNHTPKDGSEEARLVEVLQNPKDWV